MSFPLAASIRFEAFYGCTGLTSASFPKLTSIEGHAFSNTGTKALTLTLPKAAPTVSSESLYTSSYSKAVTVKTPASRTGYDSTWEANFKKAFGASGTITLSFADL